MTLPRHTSLSVHVSHCFPASLTVLSVLLSAGRVDKMKAIQVISLTLLAVLTASAQDLKLGKCPEPAVEAKFDVTRVNTELLFIPYLSFAINYFFCTASDTCHNN